MNKSTRKLVLDTTLREGEQASGICFSLAEKIELVKQLSAFGVDIIEIGHPGISAIEEEICRKIADAVSHVDLLVHARACIDDIIAAKNSGAQWVGIWASYNDISLATKFQHKSREWIKNQVSESILFAKNAGLKVRFTIEDASRTSETLIHELGVIAVNAGADRISLADTVGIWHPKECAKMIQFAVENFDCEIEVHLHNDLGLAQANAIAALDAGASVIDTSILGVGERAGICDLFSTCASLEKFYKVQKFNMALSQQLSSLVSRVGSFTPEPHHPIVGRSVFTHTSKYHIKAIEKQPTAYEALNPVHYGASRKITTNTLERTVQQRFTQALKIQKPFVKTASELLHHRDGVGTRWVFMDNRVDPRSPIYIIERIFEKDYQNNYEPHVDSHAHYCDSCFVFMGNNQDGTGLTVSVTFGKDDNQTTEIVESPASILIPAEVFHSYAYIKGTGRFLNFVLSPNYNQSLLITATEDP